MVSQPLSASRPDPEILTFPQTFGFWISPFFSHTRALGGDYRKCIFRLESTFVLLKSETIGAHKFSYIQKSRFQTLQCLVNSQKNGRLFGHLKIKFGKCDSRLESPNVLHVRNIVPDMVSDGATPKSYSFRS